MSLEAIRIEREEFTAVTLDLIGRSFGVGSLDGFDFFYTAEDLFEEVMYRRAGNPAVSDKCDSAMMFFRLRPTLARLHPSVPITPSTSLRKLARISTKRLSKRLARETGLAMPEPLPGKLGCASWLCGFILAPLAWWLIDVRAFAFVAVASFVMMLFDRGGFWAEWRDVWSLADAVASKNVTRKDAVGLQGRTGDLWRRFTEILALSAVPEANGARLVDAHRIGRMTRIELV